MLAPSETCSRPSHDEMNENVPNENGAAGWTLSEATVFSMVDPSDPNSTTEKDSDANGNAESALKNNTPLAASAAEPTAVTTEPAAVVSAVTTETLENHVQRPVADPPVDPPIDDTQMEEQSQGEGDNVVQSLPMVTPPVETKNVSELETLPVQQQQQQLPSASSQIVIDLLDDDDDDDDDDVEVFGGHPTSMPQHTGVSAAAAPNPTSAGQASYQARANNMPHWMRNSRAGQTQHTPWASQIPPNGYAHHYPHTPLAPPPSTPVAIPTVHPLDMQYLEPVYLPPIYGFVPTWSNMMPFQPASISSVTTSASKTRKKYKLTLVSVMEFTVTAYELYGQIPVSLAGMRIHIKKISKNHGKATFEKNAGEGGAGRWRIPLGAYHTFHTFLRSDILNVVEGIPEDQLKIASLGRARLDKSYPTPEKLISCGVPLGLSNALAPYQRGGVDFVLERKGRALIADEMGLGKTVQAIASMAIWEEEWPLLILSPSSARYHWENEFRHWLGVDSTVNKQDNTETSRSRKRKSRSMSFSEESLGSLSSCEEQTQDNDSSNDDSDHEPKEAGKSMPEMRLLQNSDIHVLGSAKDAVIPSPNTRVVVCSYGLAPTLIANGKIFPGQFQCIIVDESHMLKNKNTKRTCSLLPILKATKRCILLSGTPAFARPMELWPQLTILGSNGSGFWQNESEFVSKYTKGASSANLAELHTLLTSTVMIRRMKVDMLKSLPQKRRELVRTNVLARHGDVETKREFAHGMEALRSGKGVMGKLARKHAKLASPAEDPVEGQLSFKEAQAIVHAEINDKRRKELTDIRNMIMRNEQHLNEDEIETRIEEQELVMSQEHIEYQRKRLYELMGREISLDDQSSDVMSSYPNATGGSLQPGRDEQQTRKSMLNHLYTMTGNIKIPIVVGMLKRWLDDPTKGKLCIFAHHISVLNGITAGAGLSNEKDGKKKFIRIDGSTLPRDRQDQISAFQTDPTVRIAILGITAAGVAVTLTASSTVWFTELFWTPAIMIQAEDRCHRIGQQARVNCLYLLAKGTLDDLLWKLIEKKFRDLGEFVEGKEKLQIAVNREFDDEKGRIDTNGDDESDNDNETDSKASDSKATGEPEKNGDAGDLDVDFQNDIEELGETEKMLLNTNNAEDDEEDTPATTPVPESCSSEAPSSKVGVSETSAICLSDDEGDDRDDQATTAEYFHSNGIKTTTKLPNLRMFRISFTGSEFGLHVIDFKGRIVVRRLNTSRIAKYGIDVKPHVGDALVAVNGAIVPFAYGLHNTTAIMSTALQRGTVELTFAEDLAFKAYFRKKLAEHDRKSKAAQSAEQHSSNGEQGISPPTAPVAGDNLMPQSNVGEDGVIDLLDDDDD